MIRRRETASKDNRRFLKNLNIPPAEFVHGRRRLSRDKQRDQERLRGVHLLRQEPPRDGLHHLRFEGEGRGGPEADSPYFHHLFERFAALYRHDRNVTAALQHRGLNLGGPATLRGVLTKARIWVTGWIRWPIGESEGLVKSRLKSSGIEP